VDNEGNFYTPRSHEHEHEHEHEPITNNNNNKNNLIASSGLPTTDHLYQKIMLVRHSPKGKNTNKSNNKDDTDDDVDGKKKRKFVSNSRRRDRQQGDRRRAANKKKGKTGQPEDAHPRLADEDSTHSLMET